MSCFKLEWAIERCCCCCSSERCYSDAAVSGFHPPTFKLPSLATLRWCARKESAMKLKAVPSVTCCRSCHTKQVQVVVLFLYFWAHITAAAVRKSSKNCRRRRAISNFRTNCCSVDNNQSGISSSIAPAASLCWGRLSWFLLLVKSPFARIPAKASGLLWLLFASQLKIGRDRFGSSIEFGNPIQ